MADFTELHKALARMRDNNCLYRIIGLFSENNTTYVVYDYIETVTLVSFLRENSGELSWELVSKMFPPFFTALNFIHNANIYHRGISPETIRITANAEIKLNDFSISAARTIGTDITPEIFQGYAAPEQYSLHSRQGAHTDVYAVCAVLYRALTGTMPTDAQLRMERDDLPPVHEVNNNVPIAVSMAIMRGLNINASQRIQGLSELITALFSSNSPASSHTMEILKQKTELMSQRTAVVKTQQKSGEQPLYKPIQQETPTPATVVQPVSSLDRIKVPMLVFVLLLAILLVLAFIIKTFFLDIKNTDNPQQTTLSTTVTTVSVPIVSQPEVTTVAISSFSQMIKMSNLVGYTYTPAFINGFADSFVPVIVEEYNDELNEDETPKYPKGVIFETSIPATEIFEKGSIITIKVSKGPSVVKLPEISAVNPVSIDEYKKQLTDLGFKDEMIKILYKYELWYVDNDVLSTDRTEFSWKDFEESETKENSQLVIYVGMYGDPTTIPGYDPNGLTGTITTTTTTTTTTTATESTTLHTTRIIFVPTTTEEPDGRWYY
jgi:serine/threonine-protein kinase